MWHRFFITLYFLFHIPILLIPLFAMRGVEIVREYKTRCLNNNQYVVLQGSPTDLPDIVSNSLLNGAFGTETENNLRFYCAYYDEIQPHIVAYRNARSEEERVRANLAFEAFRNSRPRVFSENYTLEVVKTYYNHLFNAIEVSIIAMILYYFLLQILRFIYMYVATGKIIIHPYRNLH